MANLDPYVSSILDTHPTLTHDADSEDEDALIASLEDSPALDGFREQRLQQLHSEFTRAKEQKSQGFGVYTQVKEEKVLMDLTTEIERVVVHFFKEDFARCAVMDAHLQTLATKHTDTRFLKISVLSAPFLVTKLTIQVLPCVLAFIKGKSVDRIVGFEGLGYTPDTFTTKDLETRLLSSGVVLRAKGGLEAAARKEKSVESEDDGDDWD